MEGTPHLYHTLVQVLGQHENWVVTQFEFSG